MSLSLLSRVRGPQDGAPTPLQSQVDGLVGSFTEQATDWRALASMMAGGMAYRVGRVGVMGLGSGNTVRAASIGLGLGAEVSTFELVHRGLQSVRPENANLWRWNGAGGIRQGLLQSFITFGSLKGAGHLARAENLILQHLAQDTAMVAGHQISGALNIASRPTGTLAEQFLHAEATNLQIGAGMALAHRFMPGVHGLERGLDLSLQNQIPPTPLFQRGAMSDSPLWQRGVRGDFALARTRPAEGIREIEAEATEKGGPRLYMVGDGNGNGSRNRYDGLVPKILREVLDRGQASELKDLSQILHPVLSGRTPSTHQLYAERLASRDPEQWRLALRSIVHEGRIHESVEESGSFQEFARDWMGRPHYKDLLEITAEFDPALKHTFTIRSDLRLLQHALVPHPSIDGFVRFLLKNQVQPHPSETGLYVQSNLRRGGTPSAFRRISNKDGSTDFIGNWKRAGVNVSFDERGFLRLPLRVKKPYPIDAIPSEPLRPTIPGTVAKPSERSNGNVLAPENGESAASWGLRLMEIAQGGGPETALQIAAYLHELWLNPASKNRVSQVMDRLVTLTASTPEGEGILVRRLSVPGESQPLTLLSLPTTFLPETWSHTFLEGLSAEFGKNPGPVRHLIEVGSGTGYVSIALSKMGVAGRIIGLDKNPHASVVGAFNAAFNGVSNIEFRQSDYLSAVRREESADWIVGCLPQAPSGKSSKSLSLRELADYGQDLGLKHFEDPFGLGTLARTLEEAHRQLTDSRSRLFLMVADRAGVPMMEDLFARRGFHPRVIHTAQIRQAFGTDLGPMARVEQSTGFQYTFRSSEGEILSATEALSRKGEEIQHFLHLIEGRPYRSLLEESLAGLKLEDSDLRYTEHAGEEHRGLQAALAENLSRQWGLSLSPENVFIAPSREALLEGILSLSLSGEGRWAWVGERPEKSPVDSLFPNSEPLVFEDFRAALAGLQENRFELLLLNLPRQVIDVNLLSDFLNQASSQGTRLVFLEDHPALISSRERALAEALAGLSPSPDWIILQSLGDRFGLRELPLAAAVVSSPAFYSDLARYADVSYSRASSPLQSLYAPFVGRLNQDGSFLEEGNRPLPFPWSVNAQPPSSALATAIQLSRAFEADPKTNHPDPIDLSFGESEFRPALPEVPLSQLKTPLLGGEALERGGREAVSRYLREARRGDFSPAEIVLGGGVQPLLLSTLRTLRQTGQGSKLEVLVPEPSYGIYFPTVQVAGKGIELVPLPTTAAGRFLVTPRQLTSLKRKRGVDRALLINTPSNPAGQFYDSEMLPELFRAARGRGIYLLMDEVFQGLHHGPRPAPSLSSPVFREEGGEGLALFGGLSKEFALAGLRFGFLASHDSQLVDALRPSITAPADPFALKSAAELLPRWDSFISPHREYLAPRAERLASFFRDRGLQVVSPQGGYSLFVDLNPLLGGDRSVEGTVLTRDNFHEILMAEGGLKVKADHWAGVPGHYRFVYSIDRLEEAVTRLERFFGRIR